MNRDNYQRPNKPRTTTVKKRQADIIMDDLKTVDFVSVSASTECHVTPSKVADKMAKYLNLANGHRVLDPQAGTGNLAAATLEQGFKIDLTVIELNVTLFNVTSNRFIRTNAEVINGCFLQYARSIDQRFDRIISNPPFSAVKHHVNACFNLLVRGGEMVALVPVTFMDERSEHLDTLANDSFSLAKVNTKIIRFRK